MSNSSCSFPSINDVLNQADAGSLNITTIINSCPDICTLAWGTGNPDLSGIGANISYIFQAALTIVCGPLLCLLYGFRKQLRLSERTQKHLAGLHDTFIDISAQFSIPVAVAAVIRFRQQPPFYELAFLRLLTTMQFLSLLSIAVTVGFFDGAFRRGPQRVAIIVLYGLLEFGFYVGLVSGLATSSSSLKTINELTEACKVYGQIFPWIKQVPHITAKQFFDPHLSNSKVVSSLIWLAIAVAAGLAVFLVAFLVPGIALSLVGTKKIRWAVIPMSLAFAAGMLVELVEMERTRNVMKTVSGAFFVDNQWGFGQVLAVFLWIPFGIQFTYGTWIALMLPEFWKWRPGQHNNDS